MGPLSGGLGGSKNRENTQKLVFLDPHRIPLSDPNDPKLCLKTRFDFNSSIFYFEIISRSFLRLKKGNFYTSLYFMGKKAPKTEIRV